MITYRGTTSPTCIIPHCYVHFIFSPGTTPHARHHRGTPSSSSPETVRSHPIHYRAPSSPSEGYISLPYDSFSAAHSGVTDSDAEPRMHYGHYRRRVRPQLIWTPSDHSTFVFLVVVFLIFFFFFIVALAKDTELYTVNKNSSCSSSKNNNIHECIESNNNNNNNKNKVLYSWVFILPGH